LASYEFRVAVGLNPVAEFGEHPVDGDLHRFHLFDGGLPRLCRAGEGFQNYRVDIRSEFRLPQPSGGLFKRTLVGLGAALVFLRRDHLFSSRSSSRTNETINISVGFRKT